jgi:hypothetical protein
VATKNAFFIMNTYYLAAFDAFPFFAFPFDEIAHAELSDGLQVGDHAHPVFRGVAFVQVLEMGAGKLITSKTVFKFARRLYVTSLETARRFDIVFVTPRTWIPFPDIGAT